MRLVHGGGRWALVAALAVAVVGPVAAAAPAAAETALQVDAGYAGAFAPGQPVPVRVSVAADHLVRGTLQVVVGAATPVDVPVEVPGGSQKQFLIVVSSFFESSPSVSARLREGGQVVTKDTVLRSAADQELVGLLPGVLGGRPVPGPAPLVVDAGTARFAAVGEAELLQAPGSLGPLSSLGMDAGELAGLAPAARAGVLSWVEHGGRLLIDAERGRPIAALPDDWQPGARGRASAGLGEVVATAGAMAAGRWGTLIEPAASTSTPLSLSASTVAASTLASEAGLRTPRLGWLVGFLVVYVLVAGPVVFLAARRLGRPELAWVAVPLVAVLFSTGSYVVGSNVRKATQLVHGTILSTATAGATAVSYVGVFSRRGEAARVGFPTGWSALPLAGDIPGPARPNGISLTADGPDARVALDAGQFGLVAATGPAPNTGGLEVTASAGAGGGVTGTVRNGTPFVLDDVAVLAGGDGAMVGRLAPGETRDWTVAHPTAVGTGPADFRLWSNLPTADAPNLSLWQAATQVGGASFRALGSVVAAGWTRDFTPPVRVNGRNRRPGGQTVVIGRAAVGPGGANDPVDVAVRQELVRDPFSGANGGPITSGSVVRFVLPDGVPATNLVLHSPYGAADVWRDGAWQPAPCADASCAAIAGKLGAQAQGPGPLATMACPPNGPCIAAPPVPLRPGGAATTLTVPDGAVRDGVLYARVQGPLSTTAGLQVSLGRAP